MNGFTWTKSLRSRCPVTVHGDQLGSHAKSEPWKPFLRYIRTPYQRLFDRDRRSPNARAHDTPHLTQPLETAFVVYSRQADRMTGVVRDNLLEKLSPSYYARDPWGAREAARALYDDERRFNIAESDDGRDEACIVLSKERGEAEERRKRLAGLPRCPGVLELLEREQGYFI